MFTSSIIVMAGLDPAIHLPATASVDERGVDHRVKPGDDD
jgi:hypothetical protein